MASQKTIRIIADDGGNDPLQDQILHALADRGCITGVSCFVPKYEPCSDAMAMSRMPSIEWGLHLNLTDGKAYSPASKIPSLTDKEGSFLGAGQFNKRALFGKLNSDHLEREIDCQIECFLSLFQRLDHIDTHRHVHRFPSVAKALASVLKSKSLKPRLRNPNRYLLPSSACRSRLRLLGSYYLADWKRTPGVLFKQQVVRKLTSTGAFVGDGLLTPWPTISDKQANGINCWIEALSACPSGNWEINLHPGWSANDRELLENNSFQSVWQPHRPPTPFI